MTVDQIIGNQISNGSLTTVRDAPGLRRVQQARPPSGYMPTLDGWRAISIILVILYHCRLPAGIPVLGPVFGALMSYGQVGVFIFFAISGVLICGRLAQEEKRRRGICLRDFYIRRAFRILPPALLYLLTIGALATRLGVTKLEWFSALLFFRNYVLTSAPPAHWFTGHFWSLAVEEHFYFLLPAIMVFFPRSRAAILGALAFCVVSWRTWLHHHPTDIAVGYRTDTVLDLLLIAALVALAANHERYSRWLRRLLTPAASLFLLAASLVVIATQVRLNLTIQSVLLPLLVLSTAWNPASLLGRILELAPLRWIGRLSYSLYLWQQLFFCNRWWHGALPLGILEQWPWNVCCVVACAAASYYLLERPLVRLGHRVASSPVPGRAGEQPGTSHAAHGAD